MSRGILGELRQLRPDRPLSLDEALRVAELQASRLLQLRELTSVHDAPVPEELIAHLPRLVVRRYPLGDGIAGTADWLDGRWCVALNQTDPLYRQRFSLAHELGHILEAPFDCYAKAEDIERVADHFAASLLMPKSWVKQMWCDGVQRSRDLASHFAVSQEAMTRRIRELRLDQPCDERLAIFGRHGSRYGRHESAERLV